MLKRRLRLVWRVLTGRSVMQNMVVESTSKGIRVSPMSAQGCIIRDNRILDTGGPGRR